MEPQEIQINLENRLEMAINFANEIDLNVTGFIKPNSNQIISFDDYEKLSFEETLLCYPYFGDVVDENKTGLFYIYLDNGEIFDIDLIDVEDDRMKLGVINYVSRNGLVEQFES